MKTDIYVMDRGTQTCLKGERLAHLRGTDKRGGVKSGVSARGRGDQDFKKGGKLDLFVLRGSEKKNPAAKVARTGGRKGQQ